MVTSAELETKGSVLIGAIADDFTGATDLASFLVQSGLRTVQLIGVPAEPVAAGNIDAFVVALKTRTVEPGLAVSESLRALDWLRRYDPRQIYFKYCSTFDSTDTGNIGPVADALLAACDAPFTIACPALPVNGRTVYQGHLFVNGRLLSESGMENHPLTPMTDPDLVRVLGRQTDGGVGLVPFSVVSRGEEAIRRSFAELQRSCRYAIVDALSEVDLQQIGRAAKDLKVITGGSGLAPGLADGFRAEGLLRDDLYASDELERVDGDCLIISGSCSKATRQQVARYRDGHPALQIDPVSVANGDQRLDTVVHWFEKHRHEGPVLIYATDDPDHVREAQEKLGVQRAGEVIESLFGELAGEVLGRGVRKFIVAGGETSGAVVQALGVEAIRIGPSIAPGVPVTASITGQPLLLALKSGNFGDEDFFATAVEAML